MRIAFVTTWDPHDPGIWAGTGYHVARALEAQGCELQYIGPLRDCGRLLFKGVQLAYRMLKKQAFQRDREPWIINGYARQIEQRLASSNAQAVFAVSAIPVTNLKTTLPIVFWVDATYPAMLESYRWELPAAARSRRLGIAAEAQALARASLAIFSSRWAAQSALANYNVDPAKVKVVPFGANVDTQHTPE